MPPSRHLKNWVNTQLQRIGYRICKWPPEEVRRQDPAYSMSEALARTARRSPHVATVIDVGASDGRWSRLAMACYPDARYLLIDGQEEHRPALDAFVADHPNAEYIIAAAGDRAGSVHFLTGNRFGGAASTTPFARNDREVEMVAIDELAALRRLEPPYLLKLDTHGFEEEIFAGAKNTLSATAVIVIETYNFANNDRLRFFEMCAFLEKLGFRVADLADPVLRPHDDLFWQVDLVLLPSNHEAFSYTGCYGPAS